MLWKNLARVIGNYCKAHPEHPGVQRLHSFLDSDASNVRERIATKMDVRDVGKLRNLIPEAFPKPLKKAPLHVTTNIHGEWTVLPVEKS